MLPGLAPLVVFQARQTEMKTLAIPRTRVAGDNDVQIDVEIHGWKGLLYGTKQGCRSSRVNGDMMSFQL